VFYCSGTYDRFHNGYGPGLGYGYMTNDERSSCNAHEFATDDGFYNIDGLLFHTKRDLIE
jgi:hypothetical protein